LSVRLAEVFVIFLRAGFAFGGGLSILAILERELVTRRRIIGRDEFLTMYALGRIVPSGTMTALAVGLGHRLAGWAGTVVALVALTLPAFVSTVALTAAYHALRGTRTLALLSVTVLPAALALVVAAAVNLARSAIGRPAETVLAVAALVASLVFHVNPAVVLVVSGVGGALLLGPVKQP
jgi:chromate transporter